MKKTLFLSAVAACVLAPLTTAQAFVGDRVVSGGQCHIILSHPPTQTGHWDCGSSVNYGGQTGTVECGAEGSNRCHLVGANGETILSGTWTRAEQAGPFRIATEDEICGNGEIEGTEVCDDGNRINGDACTNACNAARCGDGIVAESELCDDGNESNRDGCLNNCMPASCGDGYTREGFETCDGSAASPSGGTRGPARCTDTCRSTTCGDGFLQPDEVCDDGNRNNNDECTNACQRPTCGDGFLQEGEACDDGNGNAADECTILCAEAVCGDGFIWDGMETCDDGNTESGDGCDATCMLEEPSEGGEDAGPGDAGVDAGPDPDAGSEPEDAGAEPDAGAIDAGPAQDAGEEEVPESGGGCAASGGSDIPGALGWSLLLMGWASRRRRR